MADDRMTSIDVDAPLTKREAAWVYGTLAAAFFVVCALAAFALGVLPW
jgi:hypothetical protein